MKAKVEIKTTPYKKRWAEISWEDDDAEGEHFYMSATYPGKYSCRSAIDRFLEKMGLEEIKKKD